MKYNLIKSTDTHMTRSRVGLPRGKRFYPSEASVVWEDADGVRRVAGNCARRTYFRLTGQEKSGEPDAYTQWIFALGKAVEEILVEEWKQMGIWVANNLRFYDPEHNISGEVDVILSDPEGKLFGVEVKSFYGYQAKKNICGNTKVIGKPKTSQMLQTLIYVDLCKKLGICDYFKMVYYARDDAARAEFDITIDVDTHGIRRPAINGIIDYRFTVDDIYKRYKELQEALDAGEVPGPDYELRWDESKVEIRKQLGEVSKTAYEKWSKNPKKNPIGDWQCKFCEYKKTCWG